MTTGRNAAFAARHSAESPDWYTPAVYVEAAREVMGGIDLDPATDRTANRVIKARRIYTEADDGLTKDWRGRVFINPPGGQALDFWRRLIETWNLNDRIKAAIWIGYSLEQLQTFQAIRTLQQPLEFVTCIPRARIAFVENAAKRRARLAKLRELGKAPTEKSSPSHGNYIVYLGPAPSKFVQTFCQFGKVFV